jgi:hypothetical protein
MGVLALSTTKDGAEPARPVAHGYYPAFYAKLPRMLPGLNQLPPPCR